MNMLTEADVVRLCDDLARQCGYAVVNLSQARASRITEGVPDRRYQNTRIQFAFFFEAKAPQGKLTREQYEFLMAELRCGSVAVCGSVFELREILDAAKKPQVDVVALAFRLVQQWAAKGFRGERKPKQQRAA